MQSSTSESIAQHLISQIESGIMPIGKKLESERELARTLQVSRSSLREAIRQLNVLGYLDTVNKVGTFVSSKYIEKNKSNTGLKEFIKLAPILDLMEIRYILETSFIELAVRRADNKDINKLIDLLQKMKTNKIDEFDFYKYDLDFHYLIAKSSHNVVIVELMKVIINRMKSNKELFIASSKQTMERDISLFEQIINSIETRNVEKAKILYNDHLSSVEEFIKESKP